MEAQFSQEQEKSPVPKNRGMISKALIFLRKLALGESQENNYSHAKKTAQSQ